MSEKVTAYVQGLERELERKEGELATMERAVARLKEKLKRPEYYFNEELKRGSVRVKKIFGEEVTTAKRTPPKRNTEVPDENVIVPAGGAGGAHTTAPEVQEQKEEKKSALARFFE